MSPDLFQAGVIAALIIGVVAVALAALVGRRGAAASGAAGRRIDEIDARLRAAEQGLIRAPTQDELRHIDGRLDALTTQLAVTAEQLRAAGASIGRIEDYLLQRGANAGD